MPTHLPAAEYRSRRDADAEVLAEFARDQYASGDYASLEAAVNKLAEDVIRGNPWFEANGDTALFGAIVDRAESDGPADTDWRDACGEQFPADAVRYIAYCVYEADIIDRALEETLPTP